MDDLLILRLLIHQVGVMPPNPSDDALFGHAPILECFNANQDLKGVQSSAINQDKIRLFKVGSILVLYQRKLTLPGSLSLAEHKDPDPSVL